MNFAKLKFEKHLEWLRQLADKENLQFTDVLRAVFIEPKIKYRLADLASPEFAERRLIELGRVEYYENMIAELIKVTSADIEEMAENRLKKMRQVNMAKVSKLGTEQRKKDGAEVRAQILKMNNDLLNMPRDKGWKVEARANHIASKVGLSESYVRRIIATPRKTKQT